MISVIVPVYRAEKYIESCVGSILAQTYRDFELILVEDGSPDRSGEICDMLAQSDNRIRVLHKENGGAATARNAGLNLARGEYIAFVDGDDLLHPQYLEYLLALLKKTGADTAMCYYDFFRKEGEFYREVLSGKEGYVLESGPEMLMEFSKHCRKVSLISLCMKLYKREIFDGFRIPEGFTEEDSMALPHILERSKKIVRSKLPLYHWRITPGSVTRSGLTAKSLSYIEVSRYQTEFFVQRGYREQSAYFKKKFLQRTLFYYYKMSDEKPELLEAFQPYAATYRRLFLRYFCAKGMCPRERLAYLLFLVSPTAARKFFEQVYGFVGNVEIGF